MTNLPGVVLSGLLYLMVFVAGAVWINDGAPQWGQWLASTVMFLCAGMFGFTGLGYLKERFGRQRRR
jgi:hypothetical protein